MTHTTRSVVTLREREHVTLCNVLFLSWSQWIDPKPITARFGYHACILLVLLPHV